jgi:hypothetical protein
MHFFTHNTNGQSLSSPDKQEFPAEREMVQEANHWILPLRGVAIPGNFLIHDIRIP